MDATARIDEIAARTRPLFDADERIRFVYLFGSAAQAVDAEPRDVDLAVSVAPVPLGQAPAGGGSAAGLSLVEEARLSDALAVALACPVDLVLLEQAALWLQFRILGEGVVVYSRDEPARIAFRERVERAFLDFRPYHDAYLAAVRERARRGQLSHG